MQKEKINQIIDKVLSGEYESYNLLVNFYQNDIYHLANYKMLSNQWSKELTQDCFIKAFEQIERFDKSKDFFIWLKTILHYLVLAKKKSLERKAKNHNNYYEHILVHLHKNDNEENSTFNSNLLVTCRSQLSLENQQLLEMRYTKNLSCDEIAKNFNLKLTNITTKLSRVRQALKKCINKKGDA